MTEKKAVWTILAIIAALVIALVFLLRAHRVREIADRLSVPIEGAVVQRDADAKNELPIPDVVITATDGTRSAATRSDAWTPREPKAEPGRVDDELVLPPVRPSAPPPVEADPVLADYNRMLARLSDQDDK